MPYFKKPETVEQFLENVKFQYEGLQQYIADPTLRAEAGIKAIQLSKDAGKLAEQIQKESEKTT